MKKRFTAYVSPSPDTTISISFGSDVPIVHSPGYIEHHSVDSMQIDLYDTALERLVWYLKSQTINHQNVTDLIKDQTNIVIQNLRIIGLI